MDDDKDNSILQKNDDSAEIEPDVQRRLSDILITDRECAPGDVRQSMLARIALSNEHFCHLRQRDEPDLSFDDRLTLCTKLLDSNPGEFLCRFGSLLRDCDLGYFEHFMSDYVVNFRVAEIKRRLVAVDSSNRTMVKNRR
jgi:hypothetical protein